MERDLSLSRAVIISNAIYKQGSGIPDLPAAADCVPAMKALLTSDLCGWPDGRVDVLSDVLAPSDLAVQLHDKISDVRDTVLLYYVGHGIRTSRGQLALALGDSVSHPDLVPYTALLYSTVADILRGCAASTKLVILDCCHAELGGKDNFQTQSSDIDAEPVDGLYFIGASKIWEKARSPINGGMTYFTEAFIDVVKNGIPGKPDTLTADQIFVELRGRLKRAGLPEPVRSGITDAGRWPFARNAAPSQTHREAEQEIGTLRAAQAAAAAAERAMEVKVVSLKNEVERLSEQIAESVNQSGGTSPKVDAEWRAAQERLADATSAYAAVQGEARQAADAVDGAMTGQVEGESADNGLSTIMDPILFDMLRSMPNQPEPHASETEEAPTDNADLWYWPGEWRIRLSFGDAYGRLARAGRKQREEEMAYYLSQQLGSRVQVLVKDPYVFLYPGEHDEDVATRALVNEVLAEPYVRASVVLHYRNPRDRRWFFLTSESAEVEDVQKMQEDAEERHKLEIEADSARSKYSGLATWQVRVLFRSHHDTAEFARTLRADGYLPVRYWKYLIIGARHEDHARAIAEALEGQVPPGTRFIVERPFLI